MVFVMHSGDQTAPENAPGILLTIAARKAKSVPLWTDVIGWLVVCKKNEILMLPNCRILRFISLNQVCK